MQESRKGHRKRKRTGRHESGTAPHTCVTWACRPADGEARIREESSKKREDSQIDGRRQRATSRESRFVRPLSFPPRGLIYSASGASFPCARNSPARPRARLSPPPLSLCFPPPHAHLLLCDVRLDAQSRLGDPFRRKATTYDRR